MSMDWILVDLNDIDVEIGDRVVLFGDESHIIDVNDIAEKAGTISYEILTRIGNRVKKVYCYD